MLIPVKFLTSDTTIHEILSYPVMVYRTICRIMFYKVYKFWLASLWLMLSINHQVTAQHWNLQPAQSSVTFKIKNAGLWVNGTL
jgi:hypothetical protein